MLVVFCTLIILYILNTMCILSVYDLFHVCLHCTEDVACNIPCTVHTSCHPTLQHHNSYNRTETIRSETQSDLLMMGVKMPETC